MKKSTETKILETLENIQSDISDLVSKVSSLSSSNIEDEEIEDEETEEIEDEDEEIEDEDEDIEDEESEDEDDEEDDGEDFEEEDEGEEEFPFDVEAEQIGEISDEEFPAVTDEMLESAREMTQSLMDEGELSEEDIVDEIAKEYWPYLPPGARQSLQAAWESGGAAEVYAEYLARQLNEDMTETYDFDEPYFLAVGDEVYAMCSGLPLTAEEERDDGTVVGVCPRPSESGATLKFIVDPENEVIKPLPTKRASKKKASKKSSKKTASKKTASKKTASKKASKKTRRSK